ncbi:unnamed protein product [Fraxinus pennsylvanica]|uniref:Uncharacterized protein n=1 Tax=Fraxinus pennsylvanica TaxID=56036 RepID=A0AAD1ZA10_9LAMI|nr:unnamed protein product [Fraxinus pennsylvanica]
MLKNEQQQGLYNPRISFSNDFADPLPVMKQENSYREAPVSSDFEFSISNNAIISADELFSKGKLLPLKENCTKTTTLRDELLVDDDDYDNVSPRLPKGTCVWKERLKRSHIVPKKADKSGVMERTDDLFHKQIYANLKGSNW